VIAFWHLTKAFLLFGPRSLCATFHQNRIKIATVQERGADRRADRTQVIL